MKTKAIFKNVKVALDKERVKEQELKNVISFCFSNDSETEKFATKCLKKNKTRWMLNRLQWFVELSDFQKYDSVKTFFLIAMAETNIKLLENRFEDNSNETSDVKKFFSRFIKQDKDELRKYFFKTDRFLNKKTFKFDKIVDILLNVRHRVAHGKNHYDFRFHDGSDNLMNIIFGEVGTKNKKRKIQYELEITYNNFRKLMIKNAIENIKGCF
jgi:hypothetical protein